MRKLLVRLGCSFHKASAFLFKADHAKQEEFVAQYEQDKGKVQTQAWRRYFIDGVHPLYGLEVVFYCWLLCGQRFEVGVGGGRKRLNILGAYCPDDQEYLDRRYTDSNLNAQSVIELFERLMHRHPGTKRFRIYLDNARYQHAKVLIVWIAQTRKDKGVTFDLKHMPGYSPNLNLIERLWRFVKKECLACRPQPTYEAFTGAIDDCLNRLPTTHKEQMRTLLTLNFQTYEDEPVLAA